MWAVHFDHLTQIYFKRGMLAILRESGVRGAFRGSSAVFLRQAVLTGAQLASYDEAKIALSKLHCQRLGPEDHMTMVLASLLSGW